MKIALINDTHFGARGDNIHFNEYFYRFWENIFFPYLIENDIKTCVHLGDVVDRRKFINHNIASDFQKRFMRKFYEYGIDTHILIGNHDTYYKNTNRVNAIENLCTSYDGINEPHIYVDPKIVEFDGLPIIMMPWICDENYSQSIDLLKTANAEVVFGHFGISGFEMDRGNVCHDGMERSLFDRFDIVISGHFHHKSSDGLIHYLGSQYEMSWSDYDDPKGFHVFDTKTREVEFIKNPYKMFQKIYYDDQEQSFEYWKNKDMTEYKDNMIKVIVVNKQNPYLFDSVIDSLYKVNPIDINIVEDLTDNSVENDESIIDQAEDTMTILSKYVDSLTLDVNNDRLKNMMKELYIEAINTEQVE